MASLNIGSCIRIKDNSGAWSAKILNFKKKKNWNLLGVIIKGVVNDFNPFKIKPLLKKKDIFQGIVVAISKKLSKKNGIYISFSENICVPLKITRFVNTVAKSLYNPIFFELKFFKKYRTVYKMSKFYF